MIMYILGVILIIETCEFMSKLLRANKEQKIASTLMAFVIFTIINFARLL